MFDERLLKMLDEDDEVRRDGRSAVLRRAAQAYLSAKRRREIGEAYRRGYAGGETLGEELAGWENEGVWPEQ